MEGQLRLPQGSELIVMQLVVVVLVLALEGDDRTVLCLADGRFKTQCWLRSTSEK